jgi:hypothetical protein
MFGDRSRLVGRSDQAVDGCGVRAREQVISQDLLQVFIHDARLKTHDVRVCRGAGVLD